MINVLYYEIHKEHKKGEFCEKKLADYYCICNFETDFVYEKDGKLVNGNAKDILITEPLKIIYHGPTPDSSVGFANDLMYLYGTDIDVLLKRFNLPLNTAFSVGNQQFLRGYIEQIKKEDTLKQTGYLEKISFIVSEMIIDLHRAYNNAAFLNSDFESLHKARDTIFQNYARPWTLQEMANTCGYSVSRFCAIYKKEFNISPKQDLIRHRIENAKHMLSYGNASVTQISAMCGFKTIFYFSKYFKEETGMSPKEYAENNKSKSNS